MADVPGRLRGVDFAEPLWESEVLGVAIVTRMARVLEANRLMRALAGDRPDIDLDSVTAVDHRRGLLVAIAAAGDAWSTLSVGFAPDHRDMPLDLIVRIRALSADDVVVVVEPPLRMTAEVIEHLAGMVDELLRERS